MPHVPELQAQAIDPTVSVSSRLRGLVLVRVRVVLCECCLCDDLAVLAVGSCMQGAQQGLRDL